MSCRLAIMQARVANVQKGDKVRWLVTGLLPAVIAAKMRGASQIVLMSRHNAKRWPLNQCDSCTNVWRGNYKVREILGGGAGCSPWMLIWRSRRSSPWVLHNGRLGFVGVPHYTTVRSVFYSLLKIFQWQVEQPSVTISDKQVCQSVVLNGDINPGHVFTSL